MYNTLLIYSIAPSNSYIGARLLTRFLDIDILQESIGSLQYRVLT